MFNRQIKYITIVLFLFSNNSNAADLSGRIVRGCGESPVENALIILTPGMFMDYTDESGFYQFINAPEGEYEVIVCADDILNSIVNVDLDETQKQRDFHLYAGDFLKDGYIDLRDAARFIDLFGGAGKSAYDLNEDGVVDSVDFNRWYEHSWGEVGYWYNYRLLDDAEHNDDQIIYPVDGKWEAHRDNGTSTCYPQPGQAVIPNTPGYFSNNGYHFTYKLGDGAQYPFVLIRMLFGANDRVIYDARNYSGCNVALKGEGQPLIVSLKSEVTSTDWAEYYVRIPEVADEWQVYTFNFFDDFRQPDWGARKDIQDVLGTLQAIQFKSDDSSINTELHIWLDNLCLFSQLYEPVSSKISGRVVSENDVLPATIVRISNETEQFTALADLDGKFVLDNVLAGDYNLVTERPGYFPDSSKITVTRDDLNVGTITLERSIPELKPESNGSIRVKSGELQHDFDGDSNYETFFMNGVGYAPTPIGSYGDLIYPRRVHERDMALLQEMNCNTIRTWGQASSILLDSAYEYDIKVAAGFWISNSADFFNPVDRLTIMQEFREYVTKNHAHPAILCWSIGNEQNYTNGDNWAWYSLVEDLAVIAYEIEGDAYHPVTSPNGDRYRIGFKDYLTRDMDMPYLDLWGMNLYKSDKEGFGMTFAIYSALSNKPLWISEYGIDAWDNRNNREYPEAQAKFAGNRLKEIESVPFCVGSTIMAYVDEWWKAGDPYSHDFGGYPTDAHPDGFSNEEWYGVMKAFDNGNDIDILVKRTVYDTLKAHFEK